MLPARDGYAIRDSKLNRRVGPSTEHVRLQLETYGWLYEQTFGEPPVALQVHAGSGEIIDVAYEDGGERALATFEQILEMRLAEEEPEEYVGVSKCTGCGFHGRCWPMAVERHDIGLLPWVDRGLIAELHAAGHPHARRPPGRLGRRATGRARATVEAGDRAGRRAGGADPDQRPGAGREPTDPARRARAPRRATPT